MKKSEDIERLNELIFRMCDNAEEQLFLMYIRDKYLQKKQIKKALKEAKIEEFINDIKRIYTSKLIFRILESNNRLIGAKSEMNFTCKRFEEIINNKVKTIKCEVLE